MFIELAFLLGSGTTGMIVQLTLVCTNRMEAARDILIAPRSRQLVFQDYDDLAPANFYVVVDTYP